MSGGEVEKGAREGKESIEDRQEERRRKERRSEGRGHVLNVFKQRRCTCSSFVVFTLTTIL